MVPTPTHFKLWDMTMSGCNCLIWPFWCPVFNALGFQSIYRGFAAVKTMTLFIKTHIKMAILSASVLSAVFIFVIYQIFTPTWESENKKRLLQSMENALGNQAESRRSRLIQAHEILSEIESKNLNDFKLKSKASALREFLDDNADEIKVYMENVAALNSERENVRKFSEDFSKIAREKSESDNLIAKIDDEIANLEKVSLQLICQSERKTEDGVYAFGQAVGNDDKRNVPGFRLSPSSMLILGVEKNLSDPLAKIERPGMDTALIGPFLTGTTVIFKEKTRGVNRLGEAVDLYVYEAINPYKLPNSRADAVAKAGMIKVKYDEVVRNLEYAKGYVAALELRVKKEMDQK